jgi:hypothetical protein
MKTKILSAWWMVALTLLLPASAVAQGNIQKLAVAGHEGSIPVTQMNGKNFVELQALAQVVNGMLTFKGSQVLLTVGQAAEAAATPDKTVLSKDFLRAGIEEMSTIREWHTVLATAIENQFPVTPEVIGPYQTAATTNLRLAQVAATNDADRSAAQLVTNEFQIMKSMSDKYLAQRAAATYINADSLANDPLNQSLAACGQALGAMAASGHYRDDATCR